MKRFLEPFDRWQRRHRVVAALIALFKRYGEHGGSRLAAVISYYSFFSVFPLMLVFVTVLGLVLDDNPDLRDDLVEGAIGQIPVLGTELSTEPLTGSVPVLIVGLLAALWAGLGAVGALQHALDEIWDVPMHERLNFVFKRLRSVGALLVLGIAIVASTFLANLATLFDTGQVEAGFGLAATWVVNSALLMVVFALLSSHRRGWGQLLPGAVAGGLALLVLNQVGSFVVRRYIAGATDTYGTFAAVIALLSWFYLVSQAVLLAAQLNAVVASGLSPRSLTATGALTDADRRAVLLDAQRVQRDQRIGVATSIDPSSIETADDAAAASAAEGVEPQPETSR